MPAQRGRAVHGQAHHGERGFARRAAETLRRAPPQRASKLQSDTRRAQLFRVCARWPQAAPATYGRRSRAPRKEARAVLDTPRTLIRKVLRKSRAVTASLALARLHAGCGSLCNGHVRRPRQICRKRPVADGHVDVTRPHERRAQRAAFRTARPPAQHVGRNMGAVADHRPGERHRDTMRAAMATEPSPAWRGVVMNLAERRDCLVSSVHGHRSLSNVRSPVPL